MGLLQGEGPGNQILDLPLDPRVGRVVGGFYEAIIGVLARIQNPHAIQFAEQDRIQQMVHGKGIIRMPLQDLAKLLHCPVLLEVVEMLEGGGVQGIAGTKGQVVRRCGFMGVFRASRRGLSPCRRQAAEPSQEED